MTLASCQLLPTQAPGTNMAPPPPPPLVLPLLLYPDLSLNSLSLPGPMFPTQRIPLLSPPSPLPSRMAEPGQDMVELGPVVPMQNTCGKVGAETGFFGTEEAPCRKDEVKQQLCGRGLHLGLSREASGHEGARDGSATTSLGTLFQ